MGQGDKKREWLKRLLNFCTKDQVELFNKMYGSVETIEPKKMDWAISQCRTTVEKNLRGMKAVDLDRLMRGKMDDLSEKKTTPRTGLSYHAVNQLTAVGKRKLTL